MLKQRYFGSGLNVRGKKFDPATLKIVSFLADIITPDLKLENIFDEKKK